MESCALLLFGFLLLLFSFVSTQEASNLPNDKQFVGNSQSGFPIFSTSNGNILYPVPSKDNPNAIEWVEITDFMTGSVIIGSGEGNLPIFQLNDGDIAYLKIMAKDDTSIDIPNNNIINAIPPTQPRYAPKRPAGGPTNDLDALLADLQGKRPATDPPNGKNQVPEAFKNVDTLDFPSGVKLTETCYVHEGHSTCDPHFIIGGAMKCGTTSLFTYLQNHPNVLSLANNPKLNGVPVLGAKEVRFFGDPIFTNTIQSKGTVGALEEYLNVFPPISPNSNFVTGESSPMYICQHGVAARINRVLPAVKNIILLRDPIDRLYSEHWFKLSLGRTRLPPVQEAYDKFEACTRQEIALYNYCGIVELSYEVPTIQKIMELEVCYAQTSKVSRMDPNQNPDCQPGGRFHELCRPAGDHIPCNNMGIKNSLYVFQMLEWVEEFPPNRLLVLPSEELYDNPSGLMGDIIDFLHIEEEYPFDWNVITGKAYNIVSAREATKTSYAPLGIGESSANTLSEKYPPIQDNFRRELQDFFSSYNGLLSQLLDKPNFWDY